MVLRDFKLTRRLLLDEGLVSGRERTDCTMRLVPMDGEIRLSYCPEDGGMCLRVL